MNANRPRNKCPAVVPWIGACFVLLTLTLGAAQLEGFGRAAAMAADSQQQSEVSVGEFEYFPAQYVNRANELDDHIQAF